MIKTFTVPLKGMRIKYDMQQGTDIPQWVWSNYLGIYLCSTQTAINSASIVVGCGTCVRYKDIG